MEENIGHLSNYYNKCVFNVLIKKGNIEIYIICCNYFQYLVILRNLSIHTYSCLHQCLYDNLLLSFFRDLATLFSNTFKVKGKFHQEYKLYQIDLKKSVDSLRVA